MTDVSPWVARWAHLWPAGSRVLDVACGSGRHVRFLASRGLAVTALDRDGTALSALHGVAAECVMADIEASSWPLAGREFDGVLVTNYLHRPLMPTLLDSLAPGGVLVYETFSRGQALVGRPRRPEFLLEPGELWRLTEGLHVVAFEDGFEPAAAASAKVTREHGVAEGRYVQRIVAARTSEQFPRYLLPGASHANG